MNLDLPPGASTPLPPAPPPEEAARTPVAPNAPPRLAFVLIDRVRKGQRKRLLWAGALWGLAALLGMVLLAGGASLLSAALGRGVLEAAPFVGLLVFVFTGPLQVRRRVGDDARTARLLGERVPGLSLDLLGALELQRTLENGTFSKGLAEAHLKGLDDRIQGVKPSEVVDGGPLRRAAWVLALALCAVGALFAFHPSGLFHDLHTVPGHHPTQAPVIQEPITGEIALTYRYPAYTGLPMRTLPNTRGEISAPAGTQVSLSTRSDRPVARAHLEVNGRKVPLRVQQGRGLEGAFVLKHSGHYHFVYETDGGKTVAVGPEIPISAVADQVPEVQLLSPGQKIEISPKQPVTLQYQVKDDFGLTSLALVFQLPGEAKPRKIALRHDVGRTTSGTYAWDLGDLPLRPGARIPYHLEATDNDEVNGHQTGVSTTHVLVIYSAQAHREAALKKAEALWNRLVLHLADRLEGPDRLKAETHAQMRSQKRIDAKGLLLADELLDTARSFSKDPAIPHGLTRALVSISQGLRRKVARIRGIRELLLVPDVDPGRGARGQLSEAVDSEIAESEKDVLYLEALLDRQKLDAVRALARELAADRRDIARMLQKYAQSKDPQLQAALLRKVQALQARMNDLMRRMAQLSKGIRDAHLNAEALAKMAKKDDFGHSLAQVEKLIREGKAKQALALLQQLGMRMDQLTQRLGSAEQKAGGQSYPGLAKKVRKFADQLAKTTEAQKALAQKTREIRDRYRKAQLERIQKRAQAAQAELEKELHALEKEYGSARTEKMLPREVAALERTKHALEDIDKALSLHTFDLAAEASDKASASANQLAGSALQRAQDDRLFGAPGATREQSSKRAARLTSDAQRVHRIQQKLHQLFPPQSQLMNAQDRQQLQKLAQQQHQLQKQARKLGQQMKSIASQAPLFGAQGEQQLDQVGHSMSEAARQLGKSDASHGLGKQQDALAGLGRLKKQLSQGKGGGGSGGGLPMPMIAGNQEGNGGGFGWSASHEKVEIPGRDASKAPAEFRKDLLDAMKQGAPSKYQKQVKDYYEELVK